MVYVLVDPQEGRTFAEVGADGVTCVTLAFPTRKAAHDYRNRHGLAQRLTPQAFASDSLDRAAALSLEWYGELAAWRLVTDRSEAPNVTADRVDPVTGEVEIVHWAEYWGLGYVWRLVEAELLNDGPLMLAEVTP